MSLSVDQQMTEIYYFATRMRSRSTPLYVRFFLPAAPSLRPQCNITRICKSSSIGLHIFTICYLYCSPALRRATRKRTNTVGSLKGVVYLLPTDNSFARKTDSIPPFDRHKKGMRWYATRFSPSSCSSRCSGWKWALSQLCT